MIKQSMLAALAVTAALAIPAIAQQVAPSDTPAAAPIQQRPEAEDSDRDERGSRRWQREFRRGEFGNERGERRDRRSYDDRDRMGPREGMMRHRGMTRFCGPQGGRFAERMLERIERAPPPRPNRSRPLTRSRTLPPKRPKSSRRPARPRLRSRLQAVSRRRRNGSPRCWRPAAPH